MCLLQWVDAQKQHAVLAACRTLICRGGGRAEDCGGGLDRAEGALFQRGEVALHVALLRALLPDLLHQRVVEPPHTPPLTITLCRTNVWHSVHHGAPRCAAVRARTVTPSEHA